MVRESFFWGKESSDSWSGRHFVMWKVELSLIISHTDEVVHWKFEEGKRGTFQQARQHEKIIEFYVKQKV